MKSTTVRVHGGAPARRLRAMVVWGALLGLSTGLGAACDQLTCRSHEGREGNLLRTHVGSELAVDPEVPEDDIRFEVHGDVVVLWGEVETQRQREAALRVVGAVPGVARVVDEIEVADEADAK
jgi:hypothetical protein